MTQHEQCQQARHVPCNCGAAADHDCNCGPGDYCLSRFTRARRAGLIDMDDIARLIRTNLRTVHDPGAAA